MRILFCSDPLKSYLPDPDFQQEYEAAKRFGFDVGLIDYEALSGGDVERGLRRITDAEGRELALYRGWMLRMGDYETLHSGFLARNIELINSPAQYRHAHYLPDSLTVIASQTPQTIVVPLDESRTFNIDEIMESLGVFGDGPLILKDYVKSRKHDWLEACYIPSAASRDDMERGVTSFVNMQGSSLSGGLVFRKFLPLQQIGNHAKSGMPLALEFRTFFYRGQPLLTSKCWDSADYEIENPPLDQFLETAHGVQSNFFTMDIAQTASGGWLIVELGDGQVAGLPRANDIEPFHRALFEQVT